MFEEESRARFDIGAHHFGTLAVRAEPNHLPPIRPILIDLRVSAEANGASGEIILQAVHGA